MSTDTASVEALADEIESLLLRHPFNYLHQCGETLRNACAALRDMADDQGEDQAVIAVWRGRTERAEAERDALARRVAELEADGIHSCHPECQRPVCVLVRERDALLAKVAEQEATLALQRASYEREIRIEVEAERAACESLCEEIADGYQAREAYQWPEMKTDAQAGAHDCAAGIRARNTPKDPT